MFVSKNASLCIFLSWSRRDGFFTVKSNTTDRGLVNFVNFKLQFFTSQDGLELCELLLDYCDAFISCLDSHSDGTHSLERIHKWACDVMLNVSKSVLMKKLSASWMVWPWVRCQEILLFDEIFLQETIHLKCVMKKKKNIIKKSILIWPLTTVGPYPREWRHCELIIFTYIICTLSMNM